MNRAWKMGDWRVLGDRCTEVSVRCIYPNAGRLDDRRFGRDIDNPCQIGGIRESRRDRSPKCYDEKGNAHGDRSWSGRVTETLGQLCMVETTQLRFVRADAGVC